MKSHNVFFRSMNTFLFQIILMIIFCRLVQFFFWNISYNFSLQFFIELRLNFFCNLFLTFIFIKNLRSILSSNIWTLSIKLCRVMNFKKNSYKLIIRNYIFIKFLFSPAISIISSKTNITSGDLKFHILDRSLIEKLVKVQ